MCEEAHERALAWRLQHAQAETSELICNLIRYGYKRVPAHLDPCQVVEQELGRPLSLSEKMAAVAAVLGPDPTSPLPPDSHLRRLEGLAQVYCKDFASRAPSRPELRAIAPWHIGAGYGAGWQRPELDAAARGWDGFWERCYDPRAPGEVRQKSVLYCLVDASVSQANRMTVTAKAIIGAILDTGSRSRLSLWICDRIVASDCDCGFHDGRRWTCSADHSGVGRRCGTRCCRHGFESWARADPNNHRVKEPELLPLGLFVARNVGTEPRGKRGLLKDFHKGLFVRGIIRDDLELSWELPVRPGFSVPLGELHVRVEAVEFHQCQQPNGKPYEGDRCPDHDRERFDPLLTCRTIRERWIFPLEMNGPPPLQFFYDEHPLVPCLDVRCPCALDPWVHRGRACACGRAWMDQFVCPACGREGGDLDEDCSACRGDFSTLEQQELRVDRRLRPVWRRNRIAFAVAQGEL